MGIRISILHQYIVYLYRKVGLNQAQVLVNICRIVHRVPEQDLLGFFPLHSQLKSKRLSSFYSEIWSKYWARIAICGRIMGGICTRRATVENVPSGNSSNTHGHYNNDSDIEYMRPSMVDNKSVPSSSGEDVNKERGESSFPEISVVSQPSGLSPEEITNGIPHLSRALSNKSRSTKPKQTTSTKVSPALIRPIIWILSFSWIRSNLSHWCNCYMILARSTELNVSKNIGLNLKYDTVDRK